MEWELSKENVQPLRKGRKVEILNETLQVQENSKDQGKILDSQRRSMIEAIDNYEGDDPLHPWLQCIRWVKNAYPTGGYQSELLPVLEACTRTFQDDERYKSDIRYLRVWVMYADLCKEPQEIYQFLEARSIGQDHALFYEAYATYKEFCKSHIKANEIYELGLRRGAQPTTRLQGMYQSFLKRMMQRNERKLQEDQEDLFEPEKLRHFGEIKSSQSRSSARNPSFVHDQQRRKIQQPQVQSSGMEIFVDDEFYSGTTRPSSIPPQPSSMRAQASSTTWKNLGTQKEVKKENDQQPARWTETKVPRIGKVPKHVEAHPRIPVFVDDECEEAYARMKAKNAAMSTTTLRQRVDGACELRRDQEALQKNPLLHFTESEKPSTASLFRREPREQEGAESGAGTTGAPHMVGSETYEPNAHGHESSFEEARLLRWKKPQQAINRNPVSSPREKAMLIEKSLNMFQSKSGSGRQHNNNKSEVEQSSLSSSRSSSISRVSSVSSMDEPPAFACTMPPSSQFSMNGEETVAIKKYAEELITLGADRNADVGGHQGLIDQTINTKECLSDILSMFNRPLACAKPQRKARASNNTTSRPNNSSEGFKVFVDDLDDGLDAPQSQKNIVKNNKSRAGFEIFHDEENDPHQLPGKKKGHFEVFVDEEELNQAPPRIRKPAQPNTVKDNRSRAAFEIFNDEENDPHQLPGKKGFEEFVDEEEMSRAPPLPSRIRKPAQPNIVNTNKSRAGFEIFQDEENDPHQLPGKKGHFEVFVDEEEMSHAPPLPPSRIRKPAQPQKKPFQVLQDEEFFVPKPPAKGSFEVFVDEDVVEVVTEKKNQVAAARPPLSRGSSFEVFVADDDVGVNNKKQEATKLSSHGLKIFQDTTELSSKPSSKGSTSGGSKPALQGILKKPQNSGFSIFVDDDVASSRQPVRTPKLAPSMKRIP